MGTADEVGEHLLADLEVGDDAFPERPDRLDVGRGTADHPLGLRVHRQGPVVANVDRHNRRLVEDDPAPLQVDKRVGGPEVYGQASPEG